MTDEQRAVAGQAQAWAEEVAAVLERLDVDPAQGLSRDEARARLAQHGPNLLRSVGRQSAWTILINQLKSLIVVLLVAACLLSASFGDWIEAAAILTVLLVNTVIGFMTELRAVRSMEALRDLGKVKARVRRGGAEEWIPAQELVPGDVAVLEGGDVITADLRLIEESKLAVGESVLTGEALPVGKAPGPVPVETVLAERRNLLFKGTSLSRGAATAVVVATGMQTELGKIATLVAEAEDQVTPLEERLERLGRRLIVVALIVAAVASAAGIASGKPVVLMVELGIALAVASIPEGLPVVATMALARGMWRLAQRDALIRKLSAVETLGAASVILTDKTGTLTENRMTVTRLVLGAEAQVEVSGEGLKLEGTFARRAQTLDPTQGLLRTALEVCVLCNNASLTEQAGGVEGLGDPLEVALLVVAAKGGLRRATQLEETPELREEAFDPAVKMMATLHQTSGGVRVAVKGAAEAVLEASTRELRDGGSAELDGERCRWWLEQNAALAAGGLRVLALATGSVDTAEGDPYRELSFVGLVGMHDPPRAGVGEAIAACRAAGIRVVMATGDQPATGTSIARAVGLLEGEGEGAVVSGAELAAGLEPGQLARAAVFARVDPAQKLTLVEAYQREGAVVAMTGDGVNDAPALRQANIGVAMGKRGTQVAREAAEMVLRDDSLDSIVVAVRQGRVIFENIRQFVLYLLSCNLAEIGVIATATLVGLPLPLLPLQILFLNLVTDVFPALALGFGEGDPNTMDRPPRDPQEPFLTRQHWLEIAAHATVITVTVVGALAVALGPLGYTKSAAISVSFLTLGFTQLWHVFNVRTPGSSFLGNDVVRNPHVWGALGLCSVLLLATAWLSPLAQVLSVVAPDARGWALVIGLSLIPWVVGQLSHALRRG